jgi:hypothetical protein
VVFTNTLFAFHHLCAFGRRASVAGTISAIVHKQIEETKEEGVLDREKERSSWRRGS